MSLDYLILSQYAGLWGQKKDKKGPLDNDLSGWVSNMRYSNFNTWDDFYPQWLSCLFNGVETTNHSLSIGENRAHSCEVGIPSDVPIIYNYIYIVYIYAHICICTYIHIYKYINM
jgi:hypothetical protein